MKTGKAKLILLAVALAFALAACSDNSGSGTQGGNGGDRPLATNTPDGGGADIPDANTPNGGTSAPPPSAQPDETPYSDSNDPSDGTPDDTPEKTPASGDADKAAAAPIKCLMDGTYSFDYVMKIVAGSGIILEMSGSLAADGGNIASTNEMLGYLVAVRVIQKDGKLYSINDEYKFIMEIPPELEADYTESIKTDYSGVVKTGEGTGEVDGKTLPYEEYAESGGPPARFYLDGDSLYAIESVSGEEKIIILITNMSGSVPSGTFDLPSGYMMIAAEDLDSLLIGN